MYSEDVINKYLRYIIIAGIFLLPFIPFIIAKSMFFPFITGKNFLFRIIVEVIFAGWIVLAFRDATYRLRFSWIAVALSFFVGVVTLADIFGENFLRSFWSNYERMDGLVTLLHLFAFFVVAGSIMNAKTLWIRFLQTSVGASVLISLYSIFQLLGFVVINQGGVRVDATLGNATYLAGYLLFHIFFAAFLMVQKHTPRWLVCTYIGIIVLHVAVLFNTMTRGAILGLIGGSMLVAFLLTIFNWHNTLVKKYALGFLAAIVIFVGIFFALKDTQFVRGNQILDRFAGISLDSGKSRFLVWGIAWEGFKERPFLGWGQDNYIYVFSKYYTPKMYSEEPWFDRAHNVIFDWLTAAGTLGLVGYLGVAASLLYVLWFQARKRKDDEDSSVAVQGKSLFSVGEKSIITGLFAAYLFHNLFVFDNVVSYIFFFSVLAFVHSAYRARHERDSTEDRIEPVHDERKEFMGRLVGPVTVVLLVVSLYAINFKHISGNRALLKAIDMRSVQAAQTSETLDALLREKLRFFETSLESGYLGRLETREQLAQASNVLIPAPVSPLIKQEFFTRASEEMGKEIEESPNNLRPRLFRASLYVQNRLFDETIAEIEDAFKISDKKQDMYILLATAYANSGRSAKAFELLEYALALEPGNDRVRKVYGALLIRDKKFDKAEEILAPLAGKHLPSQEIRDAYGSIGRFDKLISVLEGYIKENPRDFEGYLMLISAYLDAEKRDKAVTTIERAIALFPAFKDRGEYAIREIKAGRNP